MAKRNCSPSPVFGVLMVPLTRGKWALVDLADRELVADRCWSAKPGRHTFYAAGKGPGGRSQPVALMHRVILGLSDGDVGPDHINGNGLDNRRANLREATVGQNNANQPGRGGSSRYKGVSWHQDHQRWVATITVDGRWRHLGSFRSEVDAARAYDTAAMAAWPDHARLNLGDA